MAKEAIDVEDTVEEKETAIKDSVLTEDIRGAKETSKNKTKDSAEKEEITFKTMAASVKAEGDWGKLHWVLDEEGLLTIIGNGSMQAPGFTDAWHPL